MTWRFFEDCRGTTIERAFDADGNPLNLFRIEDGEATTLDDARGQAYVLSVAAQPAFPEPEKKKTGIKM